MLHPMHSVPPLFSFEVNNTQTIGGLFSTISGKTISVDWGDGGTRSTYTGTDQAYSKDYGSAGDRTVSHMEYEGAYISVNCVLS